MHGRREAAHDTGDAALPLGPLNLRLDANHSER